MKFRTEIQIDPLPGLVSHDSPIVMLGSCFTDNVGSLLERDGFDVVHNPMGTLYNPMSILNAMKRALGPQPAYCIKDLAPGGDEKYHCLDFSTKYADANADFLLRILNDDISALGEKLRQAKTIIITLGTSYVYFRNGASVGNCHKFHPQEFTRRRIGVGEVSRCIDEIISLCPWARFIFTVSPIRHTADGLHGNQLGKATLLLGLEEAKRGFAYFPSYEIMLDDLRDYRFYAADMKHPSDVAIEYIYENFSQAYISSADQQKAADCRRLLKASLHRPIKK